MRSPQAHAVPPKRMRSILKRLIKAVSARDYIVFRREDLQLHQTIVSLANIPTLEAAWSFVSHGLLPLHQ